MRKLEFLLRGRKIGEPDHMQPTRDAGSAVSQATTVGGEQMFHP